ncbi:MAG TPA: GGDEF domain-containing protein [Cellulomonadaceae bacterium]|nr:GGDEF domain-containing protein [Cellulomonadaceae bacterium]
MERAVEQTLERPSGAAQVRAEVRRAHGMFVTASAVLCAGFAGSHGTLRGSFLVLAVVVPSALVLTLLVRRRVRYPLPWVFVLIGLVLLTVNSIAWLVQLDLEGRPVATGALVSATLPLGYLSLLVAASIVVSPFARLDAGGVLDAAIIGLGGASVLWTLIVRPPPPDDVVARAAGLGDLVVVVLVTMIVGTVVRAFMTARSAALGYIGLCTGLTLVGTVARLVTRSPSGASAWWVELVWIVAYTALGAAVLHPSRDDLPRAPRRTPRVGDSLSPERLVFLGVALSLNPAITVLMALGDRIVDLELLSVTSLALVPLVLARIALLARRQASAEASLRHLATHDELTGLLNRRAALSEVDAALARVDAREVSAALVVYLDVDGLKRINDRYGHAAGDALLVAVAGRLRSAVRSEDTVARIGGDEFVVVSVGPPAVISLVPDRIDAALGHPVAWEHLVLATQASCGTVIAHLGEFAGADAVLALADARMYEAKQRRRLAAAQAMDANESAARGR